MDLLDLAERYDVAAPRYTSYPTAADFHDRVGPRAYARAIRQSNADAVPAPVGLYLHLPFCRSLCYYCACTKIVTRHAEKVHRYHETLLSEADLVAPLLAADREVSEVHLGGGTPTYLPPSAIAQLLAALGERFRFAPSGRRRWAIEADPRTVSGADVEALRAAGFSRISLGVQDLEPRVQAAVNRVLDYGALAELVAAARSAGFDSVNFDLIYGLPLQDLASFSRTVERILDFAPDRIALYAYAHLPQTFRAQKLIDSSDLLQGRSRLSLMVEAIRRLSAAGYVHIGMDHFARPGDGLARARASGTLVRNFQGYAEGPSIDLVGLGTSAISTFDGLYAQNAKTLSEWESRLNTGGLPTVRGFALEFEDRLRRDVIAAVMCRDELVYADFEQRHGIDFRTHFAAELARLGQAERDGLVRVGRDALAITPTGRLFLRAIAMVFDAYRPALDAGRRFSRVI